MNKTVLTSFMILCLMSTVFLTGLALNIQTVKASGTIYIKADGNIDPPSAPIQQDGDLYTLTANIFDSIFVQKSNLVFDGNGYTTYSSKGGVGHGVTLHHVNNVTIKNTHINGFTYGVYLNSASNSFVSGNHIANNELQGVRLLRSSNNTISGNCITNNIQGVQLHLSSNNTLSGNVMDGNKYSFDVWGHELSHFMHSIDVSNLVDGKPIYYLVNQKNLVINPATHQQVGYLALINCANVTVEGLNLTNNGQGLLLAYANDSKIANNNLTNNDFGVWFESSSRNIVSKNNVINNRYGVWLGSSFNNTISINHIRNNHYGIWPYLSFNNTISTNKIAGNRYGVWLDSSFNNSLLGNHVTNNDFGVSFCLSSNNSLFGNNIENNLYGIRVGLDPSFNNTFSGNNIVNNKVGVKLVLSSNNKFYLNNFINNTVQVYNSASVNIWDNGYSLGGNYWSDYSSVDSNRDGLGDVPHVISDNNQDNYPLMYPFAPEMEEILVAYRNLLLNYTDLQESIDDLITTFNSTSNDLQEQINLLNYRCVDLNRSITYLEGRVDSLNLTLETSIKKMISELSNIRNVMYIFMATTVILIATTVYLATRKPRVKQ